MKIIPLVLVFLLLGQAFASDDTAAIVKTGNYDLFDGRLIVSVTEKSGRIRYSVGNAKFSGGITESEAFPASSTWFLMPTDDHSVWAFHGSGPLWLITVKPSAVKFDSTDATPSLLDSAPMNVRTAYEKSKS